MFFNNLNFKDQLKNWSFWFFLVNFPLFCFLTIRCILMSPITKSDNWIALLFFIITFIAQSGILTFLICFLTVYLFIVLCPKKWPVIIFAIVVSTLSLSLLFFDAYIYSQLRVHVDKIFIFYPLHITGKGLHQVIDPSFVEVSFVIFVLLSSATIESLLAFVTWIYRPQYILKKLQKYIIGNLVFFMLMSQAFYTFADFTCDSVMMQFANTIPFYFGIPVKKWFSNLDLINEQTRNLSFNFPHNASMNYPINTLRDKVSKSAPNILLIVIDTWRHDMLNASVTPHIYEFSKNSWVFNNHFSGGNATKPGIFSLFYSLPASYWELMLSKQKGPVFIDELIKHDYQLGIFASASLALPEFNQTIFVNVKDLRIQNPQSTSWERDQFITDEMIKFLKKNRQESKKPFFGFLFYDSVHAYSFPPNFQIRFTPWWETMNRFALDNEFNPLPFINRYKNALFYVDTLVAKIFDELEKERLLDNTIVVITSDHGEEFNDNKCNYWMHSSNFTHFQIKTPLIVHWPGKTPEQFYHMTTHYDIIPTFMENIFYVENKPNDYSVGKSLLNFDDPDFFIVASYAYLGLIEKERILTMYDNGFVRITDKNDHNIPGAKPYPLLVEKASEQLLRFLKYDSH